MQMVEHQHLPDRDLTVYIAQDDDGDDVQDEDGAYTLWWGGELVDGYTTLDQARTDMRRELEGAGLAYAPQEGGVDLPSAGPDREAVIGAWREDIYGTGPGEQW
jgi:hypothetical protein